MTYAIITKMPLPVLNVTHHLDNRGRFETGPSRFATDVVLRMPSRFASVW